MKENESDSEIDLIPLTSGRVLNRILLALDICLSSPSSGGTPGTHNVTASLGNHRASPKLFDDEEDILSQKKSLHFINGWERCFFPPMSLANYSWLSHKD